MRVKLSPVPSADAATGSQVLQLAVVCGRHGAAARQHHGLRLLRLIQLMRLMWLTAAAGPCVHSDGDGDNGRLRVKGVGGLLLPVHDCMGESLHFKPWPVRKPWFSKTLGDF